MYLQDDEECFGCLEKDNRIDDIKYWFRAVLDQLFGVETFDTNQLYFYLEELAQRLGIDTPEPPLAVVRKNQTTDVTQVLNAWRNFNYQFLKELQKTGS